MYPLGYRKFYLKNVWRPFSQETIMKVVWRVPSKLLKENEVTENTSDTSDKVQVMEVQPVSSGLDKSNCQ